LTIKLTLDTNDQYRSGAEIRANADLLIALLHYLHF